MSCSVVDGEADTVGFWPKHQAITSNHKSQYSCTYSLRWDLPVWEAARATSAEPYFFSNKVTENQPFFRFSKTYLFGYKFADVLQIQYDSAEVKCQAEISCFPTTLMNS
jgi:hypothetical protein